MERSGSISAACLPNSTRNRCPATPLCSIGCFIGLPDLFLTPYSFLIKKLWEEEMCKEGYDNKQVVVYLLDSVVLTRVKVI